jgi:hypothetical protein
VRDEPARALRPLQPYRPSPETKSDENQKRFSKTDEHSQIKQIKTSEGRIVYSDDIMTTKDFLREKKGLSLSLSLSLSLPLSPLRYDVIKERRERKSSWKRELLKPKLSRLR